MSGWGDLTSLASSALKTAQKRIDKVLDIQAGEGSDGSGGTPAALLDEDGRAIISPESSDAAASASLLSNPAVAKLQDEFFTAFGLTGAPKTSQAEQDTTTDTTTGEPNAALNSSSSSSSTLNIGKWLLGGSTVDASDGETHPPPLSPVQTAQTAAKEKRSRKTSRTSSGRKSGSEEKRSKPSSQAAPAAIGGLEESSEAELVQMQLSSATPAGTELSTELVVLTESAGLEVPSGEREELPTPTAPTAAEARTEEGGDGGWEEGDWSRSAQMECSAMLRSASATPPPQDEEDGDPDSFAIVNSNDAGLNSPQRLTVEDGQIAAGGGGGGEAAEDSSECPSLVTVIMDGSGGPFSPSTPALPEVLAGQHPSLAEELAEEDGEEAEEQPSQSHPLTLTTTGSSSHSVHSSPSAEGGDGGGGTGGGSTDEGDGESGSLASFVRLTTSAAGSPPLSTAQKSDTGGSHRAGRVSGYASPTETAVSSDIEIISNLGDGNGNGSERSWGPTSSTAALLTTASPAASARVSQPYSQRSRHPRGGSDMVQKLMDSLEMLEKQNLDKSEKLMALVEENETLKAQLGSAQASEDAATALTNLQGKFSSVCEERDEMRRRLEALAGVEGRVAQMERQLREKEDELSGLLTEGEKLSQKELKQGNIIKKLREKEKASEKATEALKKRLEEMDSLREKLKEKEESELRYDSLVHQLKSQAEKAERAQKKAELTAADAKEAQATTQASLDAAYAHVASLSASQVNSERQIAKLSSDVEASQEAQLKSALETAQAAHREECEALGRQVGELQRGVERAAAEADAGERALKADIAQLQRALAASESRNEELASGVGKATEPLLRQMDSLSASHAAQAGQWERLERDLYDRLGAAEKRALAAEAKEAELQSALLDQRSQLARSEAETEAQKRSVAESKSEAEKARESARLAQDKAAKALHELQLQRQLHQSQLEDLKSDKEFLSTEFQKEKKAALAPLETKIADLLSQLEEKESAVSSLRSQLLEATRAPSGLGRPGSPSGSHRSGTTAAAAELSGSELLGAELSGVVSELSGASYGSLVEALRSRLQTRDGELAGLREELRSVQSSRDAAAARMASMANEEAAGRRAAEELELLRREYREQEEKQTALLTMYGEKVEENEELRLDLQDMKTMYRQQIEDLLDK